MGSSADLCNRFGVVPFAVVRLVHGDRHGEAEVHLARRDAVHVLHRPPGNFGCVLMIAIRKRKATRQRTTERIIDAARATRPDAEKPATRAITTWLARYQ